MTEKKTKPYYVDNKKFTQAIREHRAKVKENEEKGLPPPRISNYIGDCILKIATKFSTRPNFINYSFREEMIEDAIENCFLYFHNFDPDRSTAPNPFAYFTQVTKNAFRRRIQKEEKDRYTKYKYFSEKILNTELGNYLQDDNGDHLIPKTTYDNLNTFMAAFEAKEERRKERRKELKNNKLENKDEGEGEFTGPNRSSDREFEEYTEF